MDLGLKGKCALVTGGSHGIGRSIAESLAREGANVAICARDKKKLLQTIKTLKGIGVKSMAISADVMKINDVKRAVRSVIATWGAIHILVNNVGGGGRWGSLIVEETSEDVWVDVYKKNVLAAIRFTMEVIPQMRKQKWGRVITITSTYGKEGGGRPWFNAAKAAETALMKNLALNPRLVRSGITFNSVAPGSIMIPDTGWDAEQKKNPKGFKKFLEEKFPLGRLGSPGEVASVVTFIASEKARLVNGASILVDGGESKAF